MPKSFQILRVPILLAAVATAYFAQVSIQNRTLSAENAVWFAVAIALVILGSIGLPTLDIPRGFAPEFEKINQRSTVAWLLSWALMLVSTILFVRNANGPAWLLHLAGILIFSIAFFFSRTKVPNPKSGALLSPRWSSVLPVILITLLALLPRLYQIGQFPEGVWYDEGVNGLLGQQILDQPGYLPIYIDATQLPAHFDYLVAAALKIFGYGIAAERLPSTFFGVTSVVFTFLLFRRWFGVRVAVVAGVLFATMHWSLTLSRFGVNGHATAAFEMATLYFLDRAVIGKRLADFAFAGLMVGLGLNFYYAFRIFAVMLLIFIFLYAILRLILRRFGSQNAAQPAVDNNDVRHWIVPALAALFGALIAIAPIAQFAIRNPDEFFARTSTVSIFNKRDEPDLFKALTSNAIKHLQMFNVRGDGNGRHNIPGEPMLDPLTGAMAVLGLGFSISRIWRPANLLMVMMFCALLMAGILSVDFEAPQAYRSNGVMPSIIYFACIPFILLALSTEVVPLNSTSRRILPAVAVILGVGALGYISWNNLYSFFVRQREAADSWQVGAVAETFAGREMDRLGQNYDLVVSSLFAGHPSTQFVAPRVKDYKIFTPNDILVLGDSATRGVAYILEPGLNATYDQLIRYFPRAKVRQLTPPLGGAPLAYSVVVEPNDVAGLVGISVKYFEAGNFEGQVLKEESFSTGTVDWSTHAPVETPFAVEIQSTLYVPQFGDYTLSVRGSDSSEIFVDEFRTNGSLTSLAKGNHSLRIRIPQNQTNHKLELYWRGPPSPAGQAIPRSALLRRPVSNSGLLGSYFRTPDWSGPPAFTQVDPQIAFYFHLLPLPRPYSVSWKGRVFAAKSGPYIFSTVSIDESELDIDGQRVITNHQSGGPVDGRVTLEKGWHDVALRFSDHSGYTQVYLYWTPPGGTRELIPSILLSPPMGAYPNENDLRLRSQSGAPPAGDVNSVVTDGTVENPVTPTVLVQIPITPIVQSIRKPSQPAPSLKLQFVKSIGKSGGGPAEFVSPRGIAILPDGDLVVVDGGNKRVQIVSSDGKPILQIGGDERPFTDPMDVAIMKNGDLLILDADAPFIYRFDQTGNPKARIPIDATGVYKPRGFALNLAGQLLVADTGGGRALTISDSGEVIATIGSKGSGAAQFIEPNSIALSTDGLVYIVDGPGGRVSEIREGQIVNVFPISKSSAVIGSHVIDLGDGTLMLSATEPHIIQRYTHEGILIEVWGTPGTGEGQFQQPTGMAMYRDDLWIVDTSNDRLQKWQVIR